MYLTYLNISLYTLYILNFSICIYLVLDTGVLKGSPETWTYSQFGFGSLGKCRVLIAFGCRSHHGCSSWLLTQQDLHNCVWGFWHTGCCSCGALAWSCFSAGHHWVCCKRGAAAWQSCPELRSCSLRAWVALLVSQRGWGHSRISACTDTNCQRSGDFKPSLAAFRAVLCTSLWLLVSWGFLVSELTLRCCQLKPAVSRRLL